MTMTVIAVNMTRYYGDISDMHGSIAMAKNWPLINSYTNNRNKTSNSWDAANRHGRMGCILNIGYSQVYASLLTSNAWLDCISTWVYYSYLCQGDHYCTSDEKEQRVANKPTKRA